MQYNNAPFKKRVTVAGTPAEIKFDCGFIPGLVIIINQTNSAFGIYTSEMADASLNQITDGAGTSARPTAAGITPVTGDAENQKGFTLGTLANFNDTGSEVLDVFAWPEVTA